MSLKAAWLTVVATIMGMFLMATVLASIAQASPLDAIVAQNKTVEVDCESPLATDLASAGWIVYANNDQGQCDASPKDAAIDVSHLPSPVVDALIAKGYHSSPLDGREMLYPPTTDTPDSAR